MSPQRWKSIRAIFDAAVELGPSAEQFVRRQCGDDQEKYLEVCRMLREHYRSGPLDEKPNVFSATWASAPRVFSKGQLVAGRYRILRYVSGGGMGEVYEADDLELRERIALKTLLPAIAADEAMIARFKQEIALSRKIRSPYVCHVFDLARHEAPGADPILFLTMEFLCGETLANHLQREGRMSMATALPLLEQMCSALDAAHDAGVIHRDFKPSNVMLVPVGSQGSSPQRAVVTDFGLARRLVAPGETTETLNVGVMGTLDYMAPELLSGSIATLCSDVYALGMTVYQMVTGVLPFAGEMPLAVAIRRSKTPVPPPRSLAAELDPKWDRAILRALDADPKQRFSRAGHFLRELRGESVSTTIHLPVMSHRVWLAVSTTALVLMAAPIVWRTWEAARKRPSPEAERLYRTVGEDIEPLTSYPGSEDFGSFSPDGTQIAFTWDGPRRENTDIYVKSVDGGLPLRLTTNPAPDVVPAWSPDGRWIAFIRRDKIFLISPLGGPERHLANFDADSVSWTPDGKFLGLSAPVERGGAIGSSMSETNSIYLISIARGETRQLTMPSGGWGDRDPSFSPDGKTLAFVRWNPPIGCGVYICDFLEDSCRNPRSLTHDAEIYGLTWTPDGREIVFSTNRNGVQSLWRVPVNSPSSARIVRGLLGNARRPAISRAAPGTRNPIPTRLVYTQVLTDYNIWRLDLRDGGLTKRKFVAEPLTNSRQNISPEFSPDGRRIAFVSNRSGNKEIWVCNSDGSNSRQLTSLGTDFREGSVILYADGSPRWSPDGSQIAFHAGSEGKHRIYVIGAYGGSPRRVSPEAFDAWRPAWSVNGRWLYFSSNRSGTVNLWKAPVDGSEGAVQVTKGVGYDAHESSDGKLLYFLDQGGTFEGDVARTGSTLWSMPVAGGPRVAVLQGVQPTRWALTDKGIYFVDIRSEVPGRPNSKPIKFFSFEGRRMEQIGIIDGSSVEWVSDVYAGSLSVSPDSRWIVWPQLDRDESDLMLINNFR